MLSIGTLDPVKEHGALRADMSSPLPSRSSWVPDRQAEEGLWMGALSGCVGSDLSTAKTPHRRDRRPRETPAEATSERRSCGQPGAAPSLQSESEKKDETVFLDLTVLSSSEGESPTSTRGRRMHGQSQCLKKRSFGECEGVEIDGSQTNSLLRSLSFLRKTERKPEVVPRASPRRGETGEHESGEEDKQTKDVFAANVPRVARRPGCQQATESGGLRRMEGERSQKRRKRRNLGGETEETDSARSDAEVAKRPSPGLRGTQCWVDKYGPQAVEDLLQPPQKIQQMTDFLKPFACLSPFASALYPPAAASLPRSDKNGISSPRDRDGDAAPPLGPERLASPLICVLQGPSGCGKYSLVSAVAASLGLDVVEWEEEIPDVSARSAGGGGTEEVSNSSFGLSLLRFLSQAQSKTPLATLTMPAALGRLHACARLSRDVRTLSDDGVRGAEKALDACRAPQTAAKASGAAWNGLRIASSVSDDAETRGCDGGPSTSSSSPCNSSDRKAPHLTQCGSEASPKLPRHVIVLRHLPMTLFQRSPAFVRKAAAYLENLLAMHAAGQRAARGTDDGRAASSRFQPLVICVGSSREESQSLQKILPSSALGHNTGVLHIKLNPVPTAKLRHFLFRVLMDEGILPHAASRSSLPASKVSALLATLPPSLDLLSILHLSNGDVRHALTSLQFAAADASTAPSLPSSTSFSSSVEDMRGGENAKVSLSGLGGAADRENSRSLSAKSRRERNRRDRRRGGALESSGRRTGPAETTETGATPVAGREAGEQSSLEGGKDGRWGLFHALGKVLYNKRLIRAEQTRQTPSETATSNTPDGRIRDSPATPYSSCSSFVSSSSCLSSSSFVSSSSLSLSHSFSPSPSLSSSSVFPSFSSSSSPSRSSPARSAPLRSGCTESLRSNLSASRKDICDPPAVRSTDVASTSLTAMRPLCVCRVFPCCDVGEKKLDTERRAAEINAARPEKEEVLRSRPGVYTAGPSTGAAELADLELADLDDIFDAMDFLSDFDGDTGHPLASPVSSLCSASLSLSASSPCAPLLSSPASPCSFSRPPPLASLECLSVSPSAVPSSSSAFGGASTAVPASTSLSSSFPVSCSSSSSSSSLSSSSLSSSSSSSPSSSSSLSSSLPLSSSVASSLPSQAPLSVGWSAQDAFRVSRWACGWHALDEEPPERAPEGGRCACRLVLRREEATVTREEAAWIAGGDSLHAYALFDGLCSSFLWPLRPRTLLPFSRPSTADSPLPTPPSSSASSVPSKALPSSSRCSSSLSSPTLSSSSESSSAAVVAHAPWHLLFRKPTRPALYFSPEKLLEETPCDLDHFALLLQENFLFFFSDVVDVAAAAAHLADADALFGRTGLYLGQGMARDGDPGTPHLSLLRSWFFALVASRGILDSNTHPCSPGSWPESGRAAVSRLPPSFFSFKKSRALVLRRQLSTRIHVWSTYCAGVQRGLGDLVNQVHGAEPTAGEPADRRCDSLDVVAEKSERTVSGRCQDCERNALSLPPSSHSLRCGPQTERRCTGDTWHASGVHTPDICRPPSEPGAGRGQITVDGLTALSEGSERCQGASQRTRSSADKGSRGPAGLRGNGEGDKTVAYMKTMWRGMHGVFGLSASRFFAEVLPFVTNRERTLQRREKTTPWPAARRSGERAAAPMCVDPHAASGRCHRVSRHPEESESRGQQAAAGAGKERETASLFSRGCLDYLCGLEAPILERLRFRESWEKWGRPGGSQRLSGSAREPSQRRTLAVEAEDDEEEPDAADALLESWGGFLPLPASLQAARDMRRSVGTPGQLAGKPATAPTLSGFSHRSLYASRERTDALLSADQRPPSVSTWQCASDERKIGSAVQILSETEDDDIEDA
ncbi:Rad17 cell cycle checkpoint protein [Toxoplasma gondii MAS]|uniref:Rad17 cell cycle checkpoint protein n=2 Tax=Toxoplasma gondii TaxID=5811 RepID=A0A086Q945_TOXGO|nr:Rad17 cell cycle checkpoint protein [Toxoplasma gondii MAS]PUA89394.1 Rad17 cell cycle checkpoint protein [Toxoplasma gondii TgCATBr9]